MTFLIYPFFHLSSSARSGMFNSSNIFTKKKRRKKEQLTFFTAKTLAHPVLVIFHLDYRKSLC